MLTGTQGTGARGAQAKDGENGKGTFANWRTWLLAILLLAGVAFAAFHWGDVKAFGKLVAHADPWWLLLAFAAQLATYLALAVEWQVVLRAGGCPRPFRKLLPLTLTKHFADQMVPTAGMSGNVVVVDRLVRIGTPRKLAVASVILAIIAYYAAYTVGALGVLLLLWLRGDTNWPVIGLIAAFLVVAAGVPALSLWLQKKGMKAVPKWLRRFKPVCELFDMIGEAPARLVRDLRVIAILTALNAAVFLLDGWTMQLCLFSLGIPARFDAAFIAFMMASMVVTLGPVPMGLGSFEAVSIATLRLTGIPFEAALSATLLFRGFTLWLPLLPGMVTTRRDLRHRKP